MSDYDKEAARLQEAASLVASRYPRLGVNKRQEITRLLYEISKREGLSPKGVLRDRNPRGFKEIKEYLIQRRFPFSSARDGAVPPHLPKLELNPASCLGFDSPRFYPKSIVAESSVLGSTLVRKFTSIFPRAGLSEIPSIKDYLKKNGRFTISGYNRRRETVFIADERHDFFKRCPCTPGAVPCGYHIFNLGFGCIYECTYCYLQGYSNSPGIILPSNADKFFDHFDSYARSPRAIAWKRGPQMRIGTGEFSDSLMLDDVTGYSIAIIDYFRKHAEVTFEFKTKSNNIENLLKARHGGNIVVAWSLNPQGMIDENEFYTSSLAERIDAAIRCSEAGYRLAFHFDPVIHFPGWEKEYDGVVDLLFSRIRPERVAWISLGTLRFAPQLKRVIEARFPANTILDAELLRGYDGKLRYPYSLRYRIYSHLAQRLLKRYKRLPLYLCMEEKSMWRDLRLEMPFQ